MTAGDNGACWRCVYFDTEPDMMKDELGFCRRFPPTVVDADYNAFVGVGYTDWCGEFREQGSE